MINGSFTVIQINGKYLFLRRLDKGLWDLPGGGYEIDEVDYRKVAIREAKEEAGIELQPKQLQLCGILWQRLSQKTIEHYDGKIKYGTVYLHCSILYPESENSLGISVGNEHSAYYLFTYEEIISQYKCFSSGPLWMFFAYMAFHQTKKVQEGMLRDRRFWQGKEYT